MSPRFVNKVCDLTEDRVPPGTRIRVHSVAPSSAEDMGYVDDTRRLLDQEGEVEIFRPAPMAQLIVKWDRREPGSLTLAGEDEVEVLES